MGTVTGTGAGHHIDSETDSETDGDGECSPELVGDAGVLASDSLSSRSYYSPV